LAKLNPHAVNRACRPDRCTRPLLHAQPFDCYFCSNSIHSHASWADARSVARLNASDADADGHRPV
jgi:hypothetical protein